MKPMTRHAGGITSESSTVQYSVVIPVFDEQENLVELYRRLTVVMQGLAASYEIIFVDDGSSDGSFAVLQQLHADDNRVRVIR